MGFRYGFAALAVSLFVGCVVDTDTIQGIPGQKGPKGDPGAPGDSTPWVVESAAAISYTIGNVGIGTNAPEATVHVASYDHHALLVDHVDAADSFLGSNDVAGVTFMGGGTQDQGFAQVQFTASYQQHACAIDASTVTLGMGGSPASLVLNPSGGNVGIGTTAPRAALDVQGAIYAVGDVAAFGHDMTITTNVRWIIPKNDADTHCPNGSDAIHVPWSFRGKTGDDICSADAHGPFACTGVKMAFVRLDNSVGWWGAEELGCTDAVDYPWPWAEEYQTPSKLDAEWGLATFIVCCG